MVFRGAGGCTSPNCRTRRRTLITHDNAELKAFARDEGGNIVLKPLQGSGGASVFLVRPEDMPNLNQMIDAVSRDEFVIAQEYLPAAAEGDTRFVELAGGAVAGLGLGNVSLAFVASIVVAFSTNLISGVAATGFFGGIFIPAAEQIGLNPATMAILIPNAAVGIALPWAGASCGTAFATGQIEMKDMIRIGMVATLIFAFTTAAVHLPMAPFV